MYRDRPSSLVSLLGRIVVAGVLAGSLSAVAADHARRDGDRATVRSIAPPCWKADAVRVLIAFTSTSGRTRKLALAVADGAAGVDGACVWLLDAHTEDVSMLAAADAILLGSPVHNGNPDAALLAWVERWPFAGTPLLDKLGGAFVTAGGPSSGAESTLAALHRSLLSFGLLIVGGADWRSAYGVVASGADGPTPDADAAAFALGARIATLSARTARVTGSSAPCPSRCVATRQPRAAASAP